MTATPASTTTVAGPAARAQRTLLPYVLLLIGTSAALQVAIALTGNRIGILSGILTAVVALVYAVYLVGPGRSLGTVRYGRLVAHALTYVAVNAGFALHLYILLVIGSPAAQGTVGFPMNAGWVGAALAMPGIWGVGLLILGVGAILDRGYEARSA
jgi:hypothetical protein